MGIRTGMNAPAVLIEKYINSAYDDVKLVADNIDSVVTLSENIGINSDAFVTNADNIESIVLLANVENIDKLGEDYQYVDIVANDLVGTRSSILEMGDVSDTVDTTIEEDSYIKTVALSIIDVSTVAESISNITIIAGDTSDINVVAADLNNNFTNVIDCEQVTEAVENTNISNSSIVTVADNITNINLIASAITSGVSTSFTVDNTVLTFTNGILTDISN